MAIQMIDHILHRDVCDEAQISRAGRWMVSFGLELFPAFMQIDFLRSKNKDGAYARILVFE